LLERNFPANGSIFLTAHVSLINERAFTRSWPEAQKTGPNCFDQDVVDVDVVLLEKLE